jgi:hypothetical protein
MNFQGDCVLLIALTLMVATRGGKLGFLNFWFLMVFYITCLCILHDFRFGKAIIDGVQNHAIYN